MTCNRTSIGGWEAFTWSSVGGSSGGRERGDDNIKITEELSYEEDFSIFPNPGKGQINIRVSKPARLNIVDSRGSTIITKDVQEALTINDLTPGLYIVNMNANGRRRSKKMIVE